MAIRNRLQNDWNDWIRYAKVLLIDQIWKMSYSTHCTITIMSIEYLGTYMEFWQEYIYKHKRFHVGRHAACDLTYIKKSSQSQRQTDAVFMRGTRGRDRVPTLTWVPPVRRAFPRDISQPLWEQNFSTSVVLKGDHGIVSAFKIGSRACGFPMNTVNLTLSSVRISTVIAVQCLKI